MSHCDTSFELLSSWTCVVRVLRLSTPLELDYSNSRVVELLSRRTYIVRAVEHSIVEQSIVEPGFFVSNLVCSHCQGSLVKPLLEPATFELSIRSTQFSEPVTNCTSYMLHSIGLSAFSALRRRETRVPRERVGQMARRRDVRASAVRARHEGS